MPSARQIRSYLTELDQIKLSGYIRAVRGTITTGAIPEVRNAALKALDGFRAFKDELTGGRRYCEDSIISVPISSTVINAQTTRASLTTIRNMDVRPHLSAGGQQLVGAKWAEFQAKLNRIILQHC